MTGLTLSQVSLVGFPPVLPHLQPPMASEGLCGVSLCLHLELGAGRGVLPEDPGGRPPLVCGGEGRRRGGRHQKGRGPRGQASCHMKLRLCLNSSREEGKTSVHRELGTGARQATLCRAPPSPPGRLAASLSFFLICDICSVLVPPVMPSPSQLCRPPAPCWRRGRPEQTASLMCDEAEPSHGAR